ncbi:dTMP kinase [Psychrobacter maritimus]|uniref:dTMP kinase n=1 Tax=Psychrobacter maritimus TaxID=256325 RepID=UPI0039AF7B06
MKGKFIVFEGIDGSGTTTQSELLADFFRDIQCTSYLTSEPSSGPIGNLIRQGMKGRVIFAKDNKLSSKTDHLFDEQMAYLFAADRHDHLYNEVDGIVKLVNSGAMVISTRYYFSSLAYHCNSEEDELFVKSLNQKFPQPDLVIYLDNTVGSSLERISSRAFVDEYENEQKLKLVSENYRKIFDKYTGNLAIIKANKSIEEIQSEIISVVKEIL